MISETEEKILSEIENLKSMVSQIEVLKALIVIKDHAWVSKKVLMTLTGFKSPTINSMASRGQILKKGPLYSYRSYLEYLEIINKEKRRR